MIQGICGLALKLSTEKNEDCVRTREQFEQARLYKINSLSGNNSNNF